VRNAYCLDRNYGGTLIIWDRLFGTYVAERDDEPVVYGTLVPLQKLEPALGQPQELCGHLAPGAQHRAGAEQTDARVCAAWSGQRRCASALDPA